ncbi:T9SS type A sorting domain-containing protein [Polaribacter cellanae]|uniref:T9SS type A sorting domain-containing protein n=1 Tax=Polaribacter cellanae TaxID=2818493 RepID=A0A975CNG9_9FLAO|nr:T9SS type A sorting domain-containing protein [Polaribacter cellanae]QTE22450.1 T9SS type A sorting domain-containing protein [Polaribacter cellanae]
MKNTFLLVFEFGGIQYLSKKSTKVICFFVILFFLSFNIQSQTIPSTGSSATTCGDCTPTGWLDTGGTPDISGRLVSGGEGSTGGGATWNSSPLPLPPTGHTTWISIRDVGPDYPEESVTAKIGGLIPNKFYTVTVYAMTSISNQDGGTGNNVYYAGTYMDKFDYQIDTNPRQTIIAISKESWSVAKTFFVGTPDINGEVSLTFFPRNDGGFTAANQNTQLLEEVNIAVEINAVDEVDTDKDGIPDTIDIDDDNDGILDTVETTVSGTYYNPLGDEDGDALPNYLDNRDDGTGDGSSTSYDDINGDGIPNIFDFDNDGIPNHLDLDADNDGIPDIIEAQSTTGYIPPSGIVGANGLDSAYEAGNDTTAANGLGGLNGTGLINFESTGNPDYLDLDSDGDGVSDTIEANITLTGNIGNNGLDSAYDNGDTYTDPNGSFDNTQLNNFPNTNGADSPDDVNWRDATVATGKDTDGDGIPDSVDIDDDNDGIIDTVECTTVNVAATNASAIQSQTGVVNSANALGSNNARAQLDQESDILTIDLGRIVPKNTIIEIESRVTGTINHIMKLQQSIATTTNSFTNPKIYNWIATNLEQNKQYKLVKDARYIRITLEVDAGAGNLEIDNVKYQGFTVACDTDGDGIPNIIDLDSDNDGIPDNIEAQSTLGYLAPSGSVGANGLYSIYENNDSAGATGLGGAGGTGIINTDSANDTIPDYLDTDSDNDGTLDRIEANNSISGVFGKNGLDKNYESADNYADANGTFDNSQGDNFPDADADVNSGGDVDYRDADSSFKDNDNDGIPDSVDLDDDNDGILDSVEGDETFCFNATLVSQTGVTNSANILGSPNGNFGEINTNGNVFTLDFGKIYPAGTQYRVVWKRSTVPTSGTAIMVLSESANNTTYTTHPNPPQSSQSAVFETDIVTSNIAFRYIRVTKSTPPSVVDFFVDAIGVNCTLDTDADGVPNYLDLDSDNDGIPDNIEAQTTVGYILPNGIFSTNGVDTAYTGGLTPEDTDGDTLKDYLENDSDNDGILDNIEANLVLSGIYGTNGLDNNYDNGDNYTDVNGSFDNSQANNFPDADGDVFSGGDVDYRDDTFTNDKDGDGISNQVDLDDDNDGILDALEIGSCTPTTAPYVWENLYQVTSPNGTLVTNGDDPISAATKNVNNVNVTLSRTSNVSSDSNYRVNDNITTNSSLNFHQRGIISGLSRTNFDFSDPVFGLSFTIYDINIDNAQTIDNVEIFITKQDGTRYLLQPADYSTVGKTFTFNTTTRNFTGSGTIGTTGTTTNLTINAIAAWIIKMQIVYKNSGTGTISGHQDIALGNLNFCTPLDSDSDGVFDYIDLDSDNDGIPDNFEAQSTASYIPPTGSFSSTGIDLAYGMGVTPQNTDATATTGADTIPDYLDLDSDGDGTFDILESGLTTITPNSSGRATGAVGSNGLLNTLDNGDTYNDVNGSFDNTVKDNFTDGDGDVNIGGDLDYRDIVIGVDTDKDGIPNADDIDDDNDGILDVDELAPFATTANITYQFTGTIDGSRDRNAPNNLNRDFVFGDNFGFSVTFNTAQPIRIKSVIGDQDNGRNAAVTVDGNTENVVTTAGNFKSVIQQSSSSTTHSVNFIGADISVTQIIIYDIYDNVIAKFDLGTSTPSPLESGFIAVNETLTPTTITYNAIPISADTDGDGVNNHLDIDADNDGIPDNIEAQSTVGYISPSGMGAGITDTNNNGLDDNYEVAQGGTDISTTPRNTDNDSGPVNPDYLDLDSDNDGIPDIQENGDSDNAISGNDSDGDGLDDNFEGSNINDGYDVNNEINTPSTDLPDVDSDVNTDDVDYRDDDVDPVSPDYTGNTLWLRADLDIVGGSNVSLWKDQTTKNLPTPINRVEFTQTDVNKRPNATTNLLNFNPTVTFTPANGDGLAYSGNLNPRTMYIVYNDISNTSWATPFTNDDADGIGHGHSNDTQIYNATYTPLAVRNGLEYVNGLATDFLTKDRPDTFEQQTRIYTANISNENRNYFVGNDRGYTNRVINGSVAEIILYSDAHSDARKQQVETYLAIKYGFTLNNSNSSSVTDGDYVLTGGSPKVWDYTANSTFHNDVAGIGRDDAMVLNQKQSKSVNSDAIITIGLTAISATNAANTNSFSSNKDFLVWGNNNGVINTTTETELICAPEKTIGRTWKIVENGSVGSTQVAVNKAIIDGALTTPNTIKVLKVADNASFTTNVNYVPLTSTTINLEAVYAANYNFNGVKYFTYSEINGIFWNGDANTWTGGNSATVTGGPSTNAADTNKVMVIDSQTSLTHAVLNENVEVECVWIKANSKLMVSNNRYLEFDEDFILDGEIKLIGDGQLIQTHSGLSNVQGSGKLYRDQEAVVPSVYRYHYWSSPVREYSLDTYRVGEVMKDGSTPTSASSTITNINWISLDQPGEPNRGLDGVPGVPGVTPIKISTFWIYTYLNGTSQADYVRKLETGTIERGQGYTMKSTGQNPQNFTFVGTPNDGSITFNINPGTTNLLGNPYPSALDATDFINTNINEIDGTLYFWEHTGEDKENPATTEGHNLTGYQGGYSQRNISMGIAANSVGSIPPLVYDWTNAVVSGSSITQTVDGITTTVTKSSGSINLLPNPLGVGGTLGNVIGDVGLSTSTYDVTFTFDKTVDVKSIFLFNNVVLPLTNPTVTITPNNGEAPINQLLSGVTGQEVNLNWEDLSGFTITTNNPYNLIIDNLKFARGNLPSLGDGVYHAPNRYIPVGQGFFVSASNTGGTVRFENSHRNYQDNNFASGGTFFFKSSSKKSHKKASQENSDLLPILKLGFNYDAGGGIKYHRQIGISFRKTNSFEYDNGYDSEIYDLHDTDFYWHFPNYSDKKLIIAGISEIKNSLEVPLNIVLGSNSPFEIQIDEAKNINRDVYLLDKLTNTYYEISPETTELNIGSGTYTDRFYITFSKQNVLNTEDVNLLNKELTIFMDNTSKEVVIQNNKLLKIKKVALFNVLGQKVREWKNIDNITENRFKTNKLSATVYILNIETEEGKISKKLFIE